MERDCTVACYYFPNYHVDPRNEGRHGTGWTEWELVRRGEPRFEGHQQPKRPLWGMEDEADPAVMARKIDAAADHGVDAFIFDWYYYDDGPFLERGLEQGFFNAPNNSRLKFACMWANHDWVDIHPAKRNVEPPLQFPGGVTPETFNTMTDFIVETYFSHPSHWLVRGCPYFSVYDLSRLVASFGSVRATRAALDGFREKTRAAGFPGLHLNAVVWGRQVLPVEETIENPAQLVEALGFDSVTSYVWIHHVPLHPFPVAPYKAVEDAYFEYAGKAVGEYAVPYHPNVTVGWDATPRLCQSDVLDGKGYPNVGTIGGNTPGAFRAALERTRRFLDNRPPDDRVLTINCWNEWTEGSYIEPDETHGLAYLEAVRDVFGAKVPAAG